MNNQSKKSGNNGAPINRAEFIKQMADGIPFKLINEHEYPLGTLLHPLTYSKDFKKHPDMRSIPAAYLFQRGFKKLFDDLKH